MFESLQYDKMYGFMHIVFSVYVFWTCLAFADWIHTGFTCISLENLQADIKYPEQFRPGVLDPAEIEINVTNQFGQSCCTLRGICNLTSRYCLGSLMPKQYTIGVILEKKVLKVKLLFTMLNAFLRQFIRFSMRSVI